MSTRCRYSPREKKFNSLVWPGVLLVLTRDFLCRRAFSKLDFPTLERPAKATSGSSDTGRWLVSAAETMNWLWQANMRFPSNSSSSENMGVIFFSMGVNLHNPVVKANLNGG